MNTLTSISSRIGSLWYGLILPIKAFNTLLSNRSLLIWSIFPIGITLALYIFAIGWLASLLSTLITSFTVYLGLSSTGWLISSAVLLANFLAKILLIFLVAVTFSAVAGLVSCPFNDFLAEEAEKHTNPPLKQVESQSAIIRLRLIAIDMAKTIAAIVLSIIALFLSWIPLLNIVAILITTLLLTFQYISYPQTRRNEGLATSFQFLWRHFFACTGFGLAFLILFSIPFLACAVLPVAVVAGTMLFARAQDGSGFQRLY
ncbi:MAG: EI24 domain-containing protein [Bdellovibrionota bacterium]